MRESGAKGFDLLFPSQRHSHRLWTANDNGNRGRKNAISLAFVGGDFCDLFPVSKEGLSYFCYRVTTAINICCSQQKTKQSVLFPFLLLPLYSTLISFNLNKSLFE